MYRISTRCSGFKSMKTAHQIQDHSTNLRFASQIILIVLVIRSVFTLGTRVITSVALLCYQMTKQPTIKRVMNLIVSYINKPKNSSWKTMFLLSEKLLGEICCTDKQCIYMCGTFREYKVCLCPRYLLLDVTRKPYKCCKNHMLKKTGC